VSPVKYDLGFYISEDAILHTRSRGDLKSYNDLNVTDCILQCMIIVVVVDDDDDDSLGST
jgi:hypothetical protein